MSRAWSRFMLQEHWSSDKSVGHPTGAPHLAAPALPAHPYTDSLPSNYFELFIFSLKMIHFIQYLRKCLELAVRRSPTQVWDRRRTEKVSTYMRSRYRAYSCRYVQVYTLPVPVLFTFNNNSANFLYFSLTRLPAHRLLILAYLNTYILIFARIKLKCCDYGVKTARTRLTRQFNEYCVANQLKIDLLCYQYVNRKIFLSTFRL